MLKSYRISFQDNYNQIVIGTYEEMLKWVEKLTPKHGKCRSCEEIIRYDRYTGEQVKVLWSN